VFEEGRQRVLYAISAEHVACLLATRKRNGMGGSDLRPFRVRVGGLLHEIWSRALLDQLEISERSRMSAFGGAVGSVCYRRN
jgi:hypothetical protein